jgi:hypothetical protein
VIVSKYGNSAGPADWRIRLITSPNKGSDACSLRPHESSTLPTSMSSKTEQSVVSDSECSHPLYMNH